VARVPVAVPDRTVAGLPVVVVPVVAAAAVRPVRTARRQDARGDAGARRRQARRHRRHHRRADAGVGQARPGDDAAVEVLRRGRRARRAGTRGGGCHVARGIAGADVRGDAARLPRGEARSAAVDRPRTIRRPGRLAGATIVAQASTGVQAPAVDGTCGVARARAVAGACHGAGPRVAVHRSGPIDARGWTVAAVDGTAAAAVGVLADAGRRAHRGGRGHVRARDGAARPATVVARRLVTRRRDGRRLRVATRGRARGGIAAGRRVVARARGARKAARGGLAARRRLALARRRVVAALRHRSRRRRRLRTWGWSDAGARGWLGTRGRRWRLHRRPRGGGRLGRRARGRSGGATRWARCRATVVTALGRQGDGQRQAQGGKEETRGSWGHETSASVRGRRPLATRIPSAAVPAAGGFQVNCPAGASQSLAGGTGGFAGPAPQLGAATEPVRRSLAEGGHRSPETTRSDAAGQNVPPAVCGCLGGETRNLGGGPPGRGTMPACGSWRRSSSAASPRSCRWP
jgi:hypothetical protein